MARNRRPKRPARTISTRPATRLRTKQFSFLQRQFAARRLRKTKVTDVVSMRGREHVMAAPGPTQPQTAQDLFLQSTAIDTFAYDPKQQILEIKFVKGGKYQFYDVPWVVYGGLLTASSKGRYFHNHLYGYWSGREGSKIYHPKYNYRKI